MKPIIAFSGTVGSGKDTAGDYLVEKHGWKKLTFAEPLKLGIKHLFGLTDEQLYDPQLKEVVDEDWGMSPREMMQKVGTDLLREHIDDNMFVTTMIKRVMEVDKDDTVKGIVITDVRFENEAAMVKEMYGKVVRLVRPDEEPRTKHYKHASEQNLPDYDVLLKNAGSKEELYDALDFLVL